MTFLASKAEICHVSDVYNGVIYEATYDTETDVGEATVLGVDYNTGITYATSDSVLELLDYFYRYPVTRIGEWAFGGRKDLNYVQLPRFIKTIGEYAFCGSNVITISIYTLGNERTLSIDNFAFCNCPRLNRVYCPERKLTQLGIGAFLCCPNLDSFEYDEDSSQLARIGNLAFACCSSLEDFYIPFSVTEIGEGAFLYSGLTRITIPGNVKKLEQFAFAECYDLHQAYLYTGLDSIGDYAFLKCESLSSVNLPKTVSSIGDYAFACCRSMKTAVLPSGITTIGNHAFAGCYELSGINIPNSVKTIGERAFSGAKLIMYTWVPSEYDSYLRIGYMEESFSDYLGSMRDITIGRSVTEIDCGAFNGQIPESITCMAPTPPTLKPYNNYAYDEFTYIAYDSTMLYVPRVLVNDYKTAYGWKKFKNIVGIETLGNGDVNGNGHIDADDLLLLMDKILGNDPTPFNAINADIDGDGTLSIKDATALNDLLLNKH